MNNLIEFWPRDRSYQFGITNGEKGEYNLYKKESKKTSFLRNLLKMCSGNVLSALFWRLHIGRNDSGFEEKLINTNVGR